MSERCGNMNHGRSNAAVKFCPSCGVLLNPSVHASCDTQKHNNYRKQRLQYCLCCGRNLASMLAK